MKSNVDYKNLSKEALETLAREFEDQLLELTIEWKEAQAKFALEQHKLESIFQESPAAMALWCGPEMIFEKVNPTYQAIFPDRQLVGKPFLEALPEFIGQPFIEIFKKVLETGVPFIAKEMYAPHRRTVGGPIEDVYYNFSYVRVNDSEGKPYGVYDHAFEVTDLVLAKKRLEQAKEEAERANKLKTAFLANMSHEIRTPMTAVLGFAEILREDDLSPDERLDALNRIDKSGRSLLKLIDDILDISKVEAGKLITEKLPFSIVNLVTEIISLMRLQAEQKGLKIKLYFDSDLPGTLYSDAARIRQILTNLIGNALKFTLHGEVAVKVIAATEDGKKYLVIEVQDTGIGISKEDQQKLFKPFTQADVSITREFGGTGLGLVLSQKLAQQLGGELQLVQSEPHKGSTFRVKIEADHGAHHSEKELEKVHAVNPEPEIASSTKATLKGIQVLVADDVVDNQLLIKHYLEGAGATVDLANDGEQAITKAVNHYYDVILMDIQMPHVDGIQATKRLRNQAYTGPIVALTAHAMKEDIARSKDAGCNEHLTKPVTKLGIISAVSRYIA